MGLYANLPAPTATDIALWPNTIGGQIMAACAGNHAATLVEMQHIVAQFQNIGWTWDPNIGGRNAAAGHRVLDTHVGTAISGECGFLAHALSALLTAPPPYGFGIAAINVTTPTYAGNVMAGLSQGFIAAHVGVHHNLAANTSLATGVALSNSYKWGDHVVVSYLGRMWDPSYNTDYPNLAGMAQLLILNTHITRLPRADVDISISCQAPGGGATVWFRAKKHWETTLPHLPVGGWIGPTPAQTAAPRAPAPAQDGKCVIL